MGTDEILHNIDSIMDKIDDEVDSSKTQRERYREWERESDYSDIGEMDLETYLAIFKVSLVERDEEILEKYLGPFHENFGLLEDEHSHYLIIQTCRFTAASVLDPMQLDSCSVDSLKDSVDPYRSLSDLIDDWVYPALQLKLMYEEGETDSPLPVPMWG